jgi:hypothetical protein
VVEQPTSSIAQTRTYVDAIRHNLLRQGVEPESDDWRLFLATDRDRVLEEFQEAFGDKVVWCRDARRTTVEEDRRYEALSEAQKGSEGFMVQHLVAASPANWSTRMAWEVLRDAMIMARCDTLFHVVTNVATAVAYMNPNMEMVYLDSASAGG